VHGGLGELRKVGIFLLTYTAGKMKIEGTVSSAEQTGEEIMAGNTQNNLQSKRGVLGAALIVSVPLVALFFVVPSVFPSVDTLPSVAWADEGPVETPLLQAQNAPIVNLQPDKLVALDDWNYTLILKTKHTPTPAKKKKK